MQLFCISIIDTVIIYFDLVFESLVSGQSSASMDTSVLPARHQESFSISAEQHIEVNKKVQMFICIVIFQYSILKVQLEYCSHIL